MDRKFTPARQVLNLAYEALQRGDRHEARYWAQIAAWMLPNMEDPWLILAAVAKPRARIAYLERALEINPKNQHARDDLNLTYQQLNKKAPAVRRKAEVASSRGKSRGQPKSASNVQYSILTLELWVALVLVLLLIAAWVVLPGPNSSALAAGSNHAASLEKHVPSWFQAVLAKPTNPPPPTATLTPSASPSSTPSPTATPTPLPTATITPSPTPSPSITPTLLATPPPTDTAQLPTGQSESASVAPQLPANGEKLIVVSIQEQHVYAYQGGTLVYSFVASTGGNNSTDTGTYHILDKLPDPYSYPWGFWMPDWMGIYYVGDLEDGFHALPVLDNGQRLWADDLGTPVSYGCIVLGVQDAQELYNWADIGTTVQINP